jgi:hypothetical protein
MFIRIAEKVHPILQRLPIFIEEVAVTNDSVCLKLPEINHWQARNLSNTLTTLVIQSRPRSRISSSQHNFSLQFNQAFRNLQIDGDHPISGTAMTRTPVSSTNVRSTNVSTARTSDKH